MLWWWFRNRRRKKERLKAFICDLIEQRGQVTPLEVKRLTTLSIGAVYNLLDEMMKEGTLARRNMPATALRGWRRGYVYWLNGRVGNAGATTER